MRSAFIWIFIISFVIRIWFNFFVTGGNSAFACDAAEYLRDAQNIDLTLKNLFVDHPNSILIYIKVLLGQSNLTDITLIKQIFLPLQSMSISGPVFPTFLLACYKICGQNLSTQSWAIPLFAQSILSALACILIASIGSMCWEKKTGIVAGIIAALYPGFIINSGRLYSESFACFLLCLAIWLTVNYLIREKTHYLWGLLLGITLFSLQTTRSIMCLLSFAIVIFFLCSTIFIATKRKATSKYLFAVVLGFLLCLLPWLALQKLAFGKASLIVDRVGNYNLFVGNNVDCLGWLSIPYPDLAGIEKQKYSEILEKAIQRSPERFLKLVLDKPVRLFKLPWNDFRSTIGPISLTTQAIFHQLILVFAALGLIVSFCAFDKQKPKDLARLVILFVFLLHLVYLAFITVPRYALTAMPELILFSACGILSLVEAFKSTLFLPVAGRLLNSIIFLMVLSQMNLARAFCSIMNTPSAWCIDILLRGAVFSLFLLTCWQLAMRTIPSANRQIALLIVSIIVFSALPAYCLPLRSHGRLYEYSQDFSPLYVQADRVIVLDNKQVQSLVKNETYLAINIAGGSTLPTDWKITINNQEIEGPFIPAMSLAQDLTLVHLDKDNNCTIEQESILKSLCNVVPMSPLDLRQWYLIPIPARKWQTILSNNSANTSSKCNIDININKLAESEGALFGNYSSSQNFSIIPSIFRFSWEKAFYGVENQNGLTDPAYDQKIVTHTASANQIGNDSPYIKLLIPELPIITKNSHTITYTPSTFLNSVDKERQEADFSDNELVFSFKPKKNLFVQNKNIYYLVRLNGDIKGADNKTMSLWPNIYFSKDSDKKTSRSRISFTTPWLPNSIKSDYGLNFNALKFDICFPILINAFPRTLDDFELHLLKKGIITNSAKKIHAKCSLEIYQMTQLLSGIHYEIL